MTTAFDVPALPLLQRLAGHLRTEGKVTEPDWAPFARTGVHTEKAPVRKDWWFRRGAATLRKVYILAPIGPSRLSAEFGGARDDGSAPYHPRKGSRNIVRTALQQLEEAGYVGIREKRGRIVTPSGRKLMDGFAHDILLEIAKTNPQMMKYARVK